MTKITKYLKKTKAIIKKLKTLIFRIIQAQAEHTITEIDIITVIQYGNKVVTRIDTTAIEAGIILIDLLTITTLITTQHDIIVIQIGIATVIMTLDTTVIEDGIIEIIRIILQLIHQTEATTVIEENNIVNIRIDIIAIMFSIISAITTTIHMIIDTTVIISGIYIITMIIDTIVILCGIRETEIIQIVQ